MGARPAALAIRRIDLAHRSRPVTRATLLGERRGRAGVDGDEQLVCRRRHVAHRQRHVGVHPTQVEATGRQHEDQLVATGLEELLGRERVAGRHLVTTTGPADDGSVAVVELERSRKLFAMLARLSAYSRASFFAAAASAAFSLASSAASFASRRTFSCAALIFSRRSFAAALSSSR